ncbi:hypothetical protein [Azovibrio restrictus]|uniref:hypothetical protein n=1 Tax=Azovibrio restrictus TaxID=146938 RepID=UPI0026F03341|nr:hypothetical protein [Azovibrio restrictus]
MSSSNQQIGKIVEWLGWISVTLSILSYGYGFLDTASDPSVSAYAGLIVLEGAFFLAIGLFIVWFGRRIARPVAPTEPAQPENRPVD